MDRLEQIKNTVTANGMREWTDERVNQVAREYATEVARHNLKRAAEKVDAGCEMAVMNTEIELI